MGDPRLCHPSVEQQEVGVCWELIPKCAAWMLFVFLPEACCSPWDVLRAGIFEQGGAKSPFWAG